MTKQDEIKEGIAELLRLPDHKTFLDGVSYRLVDQILSYLHSQGVVIKVERELPQIPFNELHKNACFAYTLAQQDMAGYVAVEPLIIEGL